MRTTRKAAKAASGRNTQKRKKIRQPKSTVHSQENCSPGLEMPPGGEKSHTEQMQVSVPQITSVVPSFLVTVKEENKTPDESSNCSNLLTELRPEVVGQPNSKPSHQLLREQEASGSLDSLAGCLHQIKYEVIDAENYGNTIIEVHDPTMYNSNNGTCAIVKHNAEKPESIVPSLEECNPARSVTLVKTEKSFNNLPNQRASSFDGSYKLYRFMICEWFYSHIDQPLFSPRCNKSMDLSTLLNAHFPSLFTRSLNRIQWNYIRTTLRTVRPVRRLSPAFLLNERINLERRREKLRFLMDSPMFEYLDEDMPSAIPTSINIGNTVRVTAFTPHYGSYTGEVISMENQSTALFRVRFTNDTEQILPDYRIALVQSFHEDRALETVAVSSNHIQQIASLIQNLKEKVRLLHGLENIRLNLAARHAMGRHDTAQDQEQIERYDQIVRKLLHLNRYLLQLMTQIGTDYEKTVSEPLTADEEDDVLVVDKYVVDLADQLLTEFAQMDHTYNNPAAADLWQTTMQCLRIRPEYLQQFERYLASNIGTLFDTTPYSTAHGSS